MSERVYDPNRRQHYEFTREQETLIVDVWAAPGGDAPAHIHPVQEERWTVLEGRVRFKVAGRVMTPDPGVEIVVPAGVKHSFKNVGGTEAHARAEVRPAGELQAFLEDGARLARAGYYTRRGLVKSPRGAIEMAGFLKRYRKDSFMCWPPQLVQRIMLWSLARFARA